MTTPEDIKTFVFFDLESTSLQSAGVYPHVTELSMVAVKRPALDCKHDSKLPRVLDKLSLCINPGKPVSPIAADITGLF